MRLSLINRIKLAQYHNARGVRMLKCRSGVDSCGHRKAFLELAGNCFEARDHHMRQARMELGTRKRFAWHVVDGWKVLAWVVAHDELEAGSMFEEQCERLGVPCGEYMLRLVGRTTLSRMVSGESL